LNLRGPLLIIIMSDKLQFVDVLRKLIVIKESTN
jgi:hypothetical protein